MPVPNSMADLSTLASSNFPTGTEAIGNSLDNYIRAGFAITRSTYGIASASIASASTVDLGSADAEYVTVTGTTTINSFGTGFAGCKRQVSFPSSLTITNSSNIVTGSGGNITVAAGTVLNVRCTASGVWRVVSDSGYFTGGVGVSGQTGLLSRSADGVLQLRVANDAVSTTANFLFRAGGDFEPQAGVRAGAPVRATGRVYALAGDVNAGGFPPLGAAGLDCNSTTGRGQVFAFNYANSTFLPMDYNASSHTFNNDLFCTGNITAYSSDVRLKREIVDAKEAVIERFFDRFRVREFDWDRAAIADLNPEFVPDMSHEVGAIAQEVEDILPSMVGVHPKTGIKTIRWEKAAPYLIGQIQILRRQVRDLQEG